MPQIFRFADQTTGWQNQFAVAQFNPAQGTLSAIQLRLVSNLAASAMVENHGAALAAIAVYQAATTSLTLADGTPLASATLRANRSIAVGAADGSDDFAGSGGARDGGQTAFTTIAATIGAAAELASFTGTGSVDLSIAALGTGDIRGPASFLAAIAAQSGAVVEIAYTYLVDLAASAVAVTDTTTGTSSMVTANADAGPVAKLQHQFISIAPDTC